MRCLGKAVYNPRREATTILFGQGNMGLPSGVQGNHSKSKSSKTCCIDDTIDSCCHFVDTIQIQCNHEKGISSCFVLFAIRPIFVSSFPGGKPECYARDRYSIPLLEGNDFNFMYKHRDFCTSSSRCHLLLPDLAPLVYSQILVRTRDQPSNSAISAFHTFSLCTQETQ